MSARVLIRKRGEVTCMWCSCEGATRYVRIAAYGYTPSEDWVELCPDCAAKLARAISHVHRSEGQRERARKAAGHG